MMDNTLITFDDQGMIEYLEDKGFIVTTEIELLALARAYNFEFNEETNIWELR